MKDLKNIIILFLVFILFAEYVRSCKEDQPVPEQTIQRDTVTIVDTAYITVEKTVVKKLPVYKEHKVHDTVTIRVVENTTCEQAKEHLVSALNELKTKRVYTDTVEIDSIGFVWIEDTISENKLQNRTVSYKYAIPVITNKKTIKYELPKHQFFIGGGLAASKTNLTQAQIGFLYKNSKDRVMGAFMSTTPSGQLSFGIQSYWKITLKK